MVPSEEISMNFDTCGKRLRMVLGAFCLVLLQGLPVMAVADSWPSKPINVVVPFGAGGSVDNIARLVSKEMSPILGQPIVVTNRTGAGGTIGTASVARAMPDGYTLLLANNSDVVSKYLYRSLSYDFAKDTQPIALLATSPNVIVVNNDFPANTVAELIARLKENPGRIEYGSAGVGSATHLGTEQFLQITGTKAVHVPYQGNSALIPDLLSGNLKFAILSASVVSPLVQGKRVRAIGLTAKDPDPAFRGVPTTVSMGIPYEFYTWYGLMAPAGLSASLNKKISDAAHRAMKSTAVTEAYRSIGATPHFHTPEEFRKFLADEEKRWSSVIQAANITLN
jgi:tripartite-type tricarboxylate transporter receptor subunit TctC